MKTCAHLSAARYSIQGYAGTFDPGRVSSQKVMPHQMIAGINDAKRSRTDAIADSFILSNQCSIGRTVHQCLNSCGIRNGNFYHPSISIRIGVNQFGLFFQ